MSTTRSAPGPSRGAPRPDARRPRLRGPTACRAPTAHRAIGRAAAARGERRVTAWLAALAAGLSLLIACGPAVRGQQVSPPTGDAAPAATGDAAPSATGDAAPSASGEAGPAATARGPAPLSPGDHELTLRHGEARRMYLVRVPPSAASGEPLPVVLNFHGGGGGADGHKETCGLDAVADREGFLAVYPFGSGRLPRRLLTWNAGTCCGYAREHDVDDVGFALAVVEDLAARTPVDRRRVYATGHSNGGMLAYRLAAEAGEHFAAIASVAGGMVVETFAPSRPVPVLHIHSVDDPRALYGGGLGPPFPFTDHRTEHPAVEDVIARWVAHNGCDPVPEVGETITGSGPDEGRTATRIRYTPPDGEVDTTAGASQAAPPGRGAEVVLWKLTGSGHGWPGGGSRGRERVIGRGTRVIDASEEIWAFFERHRLPEPGDGADHRLPEPGGGADR